VQIALASRAGIRRWRVARGSGRGLLADGACPHSIDELTAAMQDFAEPCQFSLGANKGPAPAPGEATRQSAGRRRRIAQGRVGTAPRGARRAAAGDRSLSTLPQERPGRDSLPSPAAPQPSGPSQRVVRIAGGLSCSLRRGGAGGWSSCSGRRTTGRPSPRCSLKTSRFRRSPSISRCRRMALPPPRHDRVRQGCAACGVSLNHAKSMNSAA